MEFPPLVEQTCSGSKCTSFIEMVREREKQVSAERHSAFQHLPYIADLRKVTGSTWDRKRRNFQILLQDVTINVLLSFRLTSFLTCMLTATTWSWLTVHT